MKKQLVCIAAFILLAFCCTAKASDTAQDERDQIMNSSSFTIVVEPSTPMEDAANELFPNAKLLYMDNASQSYLSVRTGQADACIAEKTVFEAAKASEVDDLVALPGTVGETGQVAAGVSGKTKIEDAEGKVNEFLAEMEEQGLIADMFQRWVIDRDYTMPDIEEPEDPELTLRIGTTGLIEPYSFYQDGEITGLEVELMKRFALWMNADLKISTYDWYGILPACSSGKVDYIFSDLFIREEGAEAIIYSEPYSTVESVIVVREDSELAKLYSDLEQTEPTARISSVEDLAGKTVGVQTGSVHDALGEEFGAGEILYYQQAADILKAMRSERIDAALFDKVSLQELIRSNPDISMIEIPDRKEDFAFALPKTDSGQELKEELDAFLEEYRSSGQLAALEEKWMEGSDEERTVPDMDSLTGENGTIVYATDDTNIPFDYTDADGEKGYEVELITEFCREYGYQLEILNMTFDSVLGAVATEKADIGGSAITVTEERAQTVLFSDSIYENTYAIAVYNSHAAAEEGEQDFLSGMKESFKKTFIREDRWKMVVSGLLCTVEIAVLAAVFGTVFGFLLYFAGQGKLRIFRFLASLLMRIVQGVPMLVILMTLYYIIFASSGISGTAVAVIAFTITFGCGVGGTLQGCIGAVDRGQWEAADAMGFDGKLTFTRVILPQAMVQILPIYKGEFIGMLKETSIVGYVAVQDLTKVSDIIRSRTYEAFFPLIATAVIYFVLAWLLTSVLNLAQIRIDPARHKKKALKGIDTAKAGAADMPTLHSGTPGEELARFEHMEKKYANGGVPLKDINAVLRRGDVVTIIGPSGTGKSTLMRCLNRLEKHTGGNVYAFGKPVPEDKKGLCEMRRRMGMVFQSFNLFPHLTVIENVMIGQVLLNGKSRQEAYEYGVELLRSVGMAEKLLSYPGELSGGQKQRVAIARTLSMDPEIVLFDEPTSALDPTMVGQVLTVIRELAKKGLTMMIVTHEMKFARDVSTRIFYLDQGEVYEEGTPQEIFDHPRRNRTRVFVQRLRVFKHVVTSHDYDYIETQQLLQNFGEKNLMSRRQVTALRRCFEELAAQNIIPALSDPFELKIYLEYSEEQERASLRLVYGGPEYNPLEHMDEISLRLVKASTVSLEYTWEDGKNRLCAEV